MVSDGAYSWSRSSSFEFDALNDSWRIETYFGASSNGLDWVRTDGTPFQISVYATPTFELSVGQVTDSGQIKIDWLGLEGYAYQVQSRSSLTGSEWIDVGDPLTGDGSEITVPVPVTSDESQSYYRVEVLPASE
jgi:hypothetical protein